MLLLLALLPACSTVGAQTSPPQCRSSALCERLTLVRPSRSKDKISEPTARQIADANVANESWCQRKPVPAKVAEARQ